VITSERQLSSRRNALRAFDQHAREAAAALADVRAGQYAYAAAGQDVTLWMPKVAGLIEQASGTVDTLRSSAASSEARQALLEAASAITELNNVDRRLREYIRAGDRLMAADVVFTEGSEVATTAARQVESARLADHRAFDAHEADRHRGEAYALGGAAGLTAVVLALLGFARLSRTSDVKSTRADHSQAASPGDDAAIGAGPTASPPPASVDMPRGSVPALRAAAELCTEFGRLSDLADLKKLLGRAAYIMDASGVIVWLGSTSGADLRPVLAHGYAEQTLARIPAVPRSENNAAAAAYRSGSLQIVLSRPGTSPGAVAAPLLSPDGCIGALTAEIRDRGETSDSVQALAEIFAAQLAGVLAASATTSPAADAKSRAATG
jgi:hypothetical protein